VKNAMAQKTYIDKEKNLIQAIIKDQQKPEDDRIFGSVDDGIEHMYSCMRHFPDYVNNVVNYTTRMPIIYATMEGQELRDAVMDLDRSRKTAHDTAIVGLSMLNRISDMLGEEPFAEVDTSNRQAVADFCGQYVNETYLLGIGGSMDKTVEKNKYFEPKDTEKRLRELNAKFGHIGQAEVPDGPQYDG